LSRQYRFFLPGDYDVGTTLTLDSERSSYLCRVLRLREGTSLEIFPGDGSAFGCRLVDANPRRAQLHVAHQETSAKSSGPSLHLAIALLKGSAMDRALQQATELGASHLHLIRAQRSNVPLTSDRLDSKLLHWERIIASACEQSGRRSVPKLQAPGTLAEVWAAMAPCPLLIAFEPEGETLPMTLSPEPCGIFIGPEGGWSEDERAWLSEKSVNQYRLGNTILRAETMPAVALALIQHAQGWRSPSA